MRLPLGVDLGGYSIVRELGRGGMGVVYEAFDPVAGRKVALKTVRLDTGRPPERARLRMQREAEALMRLDHPGLVPCYGAGETADGFFLAMGLVEGESASQLLARQGRFPVERALQLMGDVLEVLDYVHGQGLVHRDVKPENVMLSASGRAVVADFGLVKLTDVACHDSGPSNMTQSGILLGTPGFCPPEQVVSSANVGPPADVYGWAATLYCLLSGRPPRDVSSMQAFLKSLEQPVIPLGPERADVPEWLDRLLADCLASEAKQRPGLAEVRVALQGRGQRVAQTTVSLRHMTLALAVCAALAVGLLGVVLATRELPRRSSARGAEVARLLAANQNLAAVSAAERWLRDEPRSVPAQAALVESLWQATTPERAVPLAKDLLGRKELSARARAVCGLVLQGVREFELAERCRDLALELDPKEPRAQLLDAQLLLVAGSLQEAEAKLSDLLQSNPDAFAYVARGWGRDKREQYGSALADAERALDLDPSFVQAQRLQIHVQARHLHHPDSERMLRAFLKEQPSDRVAEKDLGMLLKEQDRIAELMAFIEGRPEPNPDLLFLQSMVLYQRKEFEKINSIVERLVALDGSEDVQGKVHALRAQLSFKDKRYDAVFRDCERALELTDAPEVRVGVHTLRSRVYRAQEDPARELKELRAVVAAAPGLAKSYRGLMKVLIREGELEEASAVADTYLTRFGGSLGKEAVAGYVIKATVASASKDYGKALLNYTRMLELEDKPATRVARGTVFLKLERYQEACADYARAAEQDPKRASAWAGLMRCYDVLERVEDARDAAQRYLDLGGTHSVKVARRILGK